MLKIKEIYSRIHKKYNFGNDKLKDLFVSIEGNEVYFFYFGNDDSSYRINLMEIL